MLGAFISAANGRLSLPRSIDIHHSTGFHEDLIDIRILTKPINDSNSSSLGCRGLFRQCHGTEHCATLVQRLFPLQGRHRVGDNPAAGLYM